MLPVNKLEIVFAGICNHHTNRPVGRCLALLWATDVWAWIHTVPPKPKKSSLPILFMCCYYIPCRSDYTQFTEYYTYVRTTSTSANHLTLQKVTVHIAKTLLAYDLIDCDAGLLLLQLIGSPLPIFNPVKSLSDNDNPPIYPCQFDQNKCTIIQDRPGDYAVSVSGD